jgi:hypothetical protein
MKVPADALELHLSEVHHLRVEGGRLRAMNKLDAVAPRNSRALGVAKPAVAPAARAQPPKEPVSNKTPPTIETVAAKTTHAPPEADPFAARWADWTDRLLAELDISDVCWRVLQNIPAQLILEDPTPLYRVAVLSDLSRKVFRPVQEVAKELGEIAEGWFVLRNTGKKVDRKSMIVVATGASDGFGHSGSHLTDFGWHATSHAQKRHQALLAAVQSLGRDEVLKKLAGCRLTSWYELHQEAVEEDVEFVRRLVPTKGWTYHRCIYV